MKIEIEVQRPVLSKFKFKFGTRVKFLNPESTKIFELAVEQRNNLKPNLNLRQPPFSASADTLMFSDGSIGGEESQVARGFVRLFTK